LQFLPFTQDRHGLPDFQPAQGQGAPRPDEAPWGAPFTRDGADPGRPVHQPGGR
jgi:hypothetical protein